MIAAERLGLSWFSIPIKPILFVLTCSLLQHQGLTRDLTQALLYQFYIWHCSGEMDGWDLMVQEQLLRAVVSEFLV